ncbi:MAG: hypothetical protein ACOYVD_14315 [Bacillota bacterium]
MAFFLAGTSAAFFAWFLNRIIVRRWGDAAIIVPVPIIEETLKTVGAVLFSTSIFYTHLVFGIIEGIWDIKVNIKGLLPGIMSLLTHSFFGLVTTYFHQLTGYISMAILVSIICHIGWNSFIIRKSRINK